MKTVVELVGAHELSRALGVSLGVVYNRAKTGSLPCYRIGKHPKFNIEECLELLLVDFDPDPDIPVDFIPSS